MLISELIKELEGVRACYGDLPVSLQDGCEHTVTTEANETITCNYMTYDSFFVVPELYGSELTRDDKGNETLEEGGWRVNIRSWPY